MSDSDSSQPTRASGPQAPEIGAARAQIEAARLRQQRLITSGRLAAPASDRVPPNQSLPGYTLLHEIHRGGQGVVYLAVQASTGRQVAVKLLHHGSSLNSGAMGLARFEREIQVLSRLKHPNIVTIHDCGRDHESIFLVMDFVPGCALDAYVRRAQPPLRELLSLFIKICDGVNAAHLRGVIHRDLKPSNILVVEEGFEDSRMQGLEGQETPAISAANPQILKSLNPHPKILDFGLAKLTDDSTDDAAMRAMTITGQFVGSLPWASPEQAEGRTEQLDIRTDVYSLGVLLYQLLTGGFPYPVTGRLDEVVRHIAQSAPVRPSSAAQTVDRELETIILKCLAKDPERRYQSAGELGRDIRHYLAGEAIEARRDSLRYVLAKGLARHRVAATAGAVILLALFGTLFVSLTFWRHAEKQRVLARQSAERAEQEAGQARAVTEFMREILTSVDPDQQGADVRLTQVLTRASQAASQRFAGHPRQEAEVRDLLGHVFNKLSLWPEAQMEFWRSQRLWRDSVGPDDPRTLICESWYAATSLNLQQPDVAEPVLLALLPRMERALGRDSSTTLNTRRDIAVLHLFRGRLEDAERILAEIRAHPAVANDDRTQIRVLAGLIGANDCRMADADRNQQAALRVQAEAWAREWVERSARLFGAESALTLSAHLKVAEILCGQGQYQAAAEICRRLLEHPYERLGAGHNVRTGAMLTLAQALTGLGEYGEPAELQLRRIECLRPHQDANSPMFLGQIGDALRYLDYGRRPVEGEALARELDAALLKLGGGHGDIAFETQLYIAHFVSMQDRLNEAESLFHSLLAIKERVQDQHTLARLYLFHGSHLARQGRFEEAERELGCAVECIGDVRHGTWDTHPDDLILAFIALYETWGRQDRLMEYQTLRAAVKNQAARSVAE